VFLDATYCKDRVGGDRYGKGARVVSQAVVIATGVSAEGRREVLSAARSATPKRRDFWALLTYPWVICGLGGLVGGCRG